MKKLLLIALFVLNSCLVFSFNITFRLNMQGVSGFSTPEVNGSFNNWCGNCNPMSDANQDGIWETTIALPAGYYEYKFSADTWSIQETLEVGSSCTNTTGNFTNRTLNVSSDLVLPIVCWGVCTNCNYFPVTFQVNMSSAPAFTTPYVSGTFNNWCGNCNAMTDIDGDGIWTTTILLLEGYYEFKFSADNWTSSENLPVNGGACTVTNSGFTNRFINVTQAMTLNATYWGSCAIDCPPLIPLPPPGISISLLSGENPACERAEVVFSAEVNSVTATPTYQWKVNGQPAGTNSRVFSTNSLVNSAVITCEMSGADFCFPNAVFSSNEIALAFRPTVNAGLSINYFEMDSSSICPGDPLSFVANPIHGGDNPSFQWQVNGVNAGTNSPYFLIQNLNQADQVSCIMTSNEQCLSNQWRMVWQDEFSGNALDDTKWTHEIAETWGNELQSYTDSPTNTEVSNGELKLRVQNEGNGRYTSARLISMDKFSFKYGRAEGRIKVPLTTGSFPAFWMLGANIDEIGWPSCGEIDIMEHINSDNIFHGTLHWYDNGHVYEGSNLNADGSQYHIYSMEWDSAQISIFIDGNLCYQHDLQPVNLSTEEFTKPFFFILNHAVGGWANAPDNSTVFPFTLSIDYVRVFQRNFNNGINSSTSVNSNSIEIQYIDCSPLTITSASQSESITIVPNPSNGAFQLMSKVGAKCLILNSLGQEIREIEIPSTGRVHVSDLNEGVYFVLVSGAKEIQPIKVIVSGN